MAELKCIEAKICAVGTYDGNSVLFAVVGGCEWIIPTDLATMAKLAEKLPIRHELGGGKS